MEQSIPSDAYLWLAIATTIIVLTMSSIKSYISNRSRISVYTGIGWAFMVSGLLLWSIPLFITRDDAIITNFIFAGTIFYTLSFLMNCFSMWYILLRPKISVWLVMVPATSIWLLAEFLDTKAWISTESYVEFNQEGIVLQQLPPIFSLLTVGFFGLGFYFISIARKIDTKYAKIRAYALGSVYVIFALQTAFSILSSSTTGTANTLRTVVVILSIIGISITLAMSIFKNK